MIKFSEEAVRRAVECTARAALNAAREKCPVKTGRLKNSITCTAEKNKAVIHTDVPYAAAVELGTGSAKPQPYLSYGISAAKRQAGIIFREELFKNG